VRAGDDAGFAAPGRGSSPRGWGRSVSSTSAWEGRSESRRSGQQRRLVDSGVDVLYTGPAAFRTCMKSELVKRLALVEEAGFAPE
jgi:hypothetical protein